MLFEKPSLRTRVSFETGMTQLGGHAIFYSVKDSPLGKKESLEDTAKTASRFVDLIAARLFSRNDFEKTGREFDVPVINMLDDFAHPLSDPRRFSDPPREKGKFENLKLSYFGDAHNNVTYDLMRMSALFGIQMDVACPKGADIRRKRKSYRRSKLFRKNPAPRLNRSRCRKAARDSDVIYTDSWMSYGIAAEKEGERKKVFMPYQVNSKLMKEAKPDAVFMNNLPAMRGYEQTADVIDGPQSIVFDQAENRLHIQKAIMLFLLGKL